MTEQCISIERMEEAINLFGLFDENIRIIEQELGVTVVNRESNLKISGDGEAVMWAVKAVQGLLSLSAKGEPINQQNVRYIIELVRAGNEGKIAQLAGDVVCVTAKGKPIKAKTVGLGMIMRLFTLMSSRSPFERQPIRSDLRSAQPYHRL